LTTTLPLLPAARHGFKEDRRECLESSPNRIVGRVVRKGAEILRIELEPNTPAAVSDLGIGSIGTNSAGRTRLSLTSLLFKFFPSAAGTGFDYLPRLVSQTTVFRPRPGLRKGPCRVVVSSSSRDALGDVLSSARRWLASTALDTRCCRKDRRARGIAGSCRFFKSDFAGRARRRA
jgi:hypothetical protein